jgi:hypothetical protein
MGRIPGLIINLYQGIEPHIMRSSLFFVAATNDCVTELSKLGSPSTRRNAGTTSSHLELLAQPVQQTLGVYYYIVYRKWNID